MSGAVLAGGEVTDTIRSGIVDLDGLSVTPNQFIYVMLSALIAAAFWLLFATKKGLPVSTTHAIIGGVVVRVGDKLIDGSVGRQLKRLEMALLGIDLKKIGVTNAI